MKKKLIRILSIACLGFILGSCNESSFLSVIPVSSLESVSNISSELVESSDISSSVSSLEESSSKISSSSLEESVSESSQESSQSSLVSSIETDSRWNVNFSTYGASFRLQLSSLISGKKTKTASYSGCLSIGAKAAAYPNKNSSTFVPFYHTTSTTTTTGSCNREHTWPKSRGGDMFENDPFMVRPTLTKDNSSRGNDFYGNIKSNEWDPASCGFEGARGEAARIIFYCATVYYSKGVSLSNNPSDSSGKNTMGTLTQLLEWNAKYPVTAIEKQINDYLSNAGYGRNPFVDHPDYANFIWDNSGLRTTPYISLPGGETSSYSTSEVTYKYNKVTSLNNITSKSVAIIDVTSGEGRCLTNEAISSTLPWYQSYSIADVSADGTKANLADESSSLFKIEKIDETYYSIYSSTKKSYLYNYKSGTHLSITWSTSVSYDGELSNKWSISESSGGFVFKGSNNIYLTYNSSKGNYQGSSSAPSKPLCVFA